MRDAAAHLARSPPYTSQSPYSPIWPLSKFSWFYSFSNISICITRHCSVLTVHGILATLVWKLPSWYTGIRCARYFTYRVNFQKCKSVHVNCITVALSLTSLHSRHSLEPCCGWPFLLVDRSASWAYPTSPLKDVCFLPTPPCAAPTPCFFSVLRNSGIFSVTHTSQALFAHTAPPLWVNFTHSSDLSAWTLSSGEPFLNISVSSKCDVIC